MERETRACAGASARMVLVGMALIMVTFAGATSAATLYVGSGGLPANCNFTTLADAVNHAQGTGVADEIRLTTTLAYAEDVIISGTSPLTISGGWSDCTDTTASGSTVITGNNSPGADGPTILSNATNLRLRSVEVRGAGDPAVSVVGGETTLEDALILGGSRGVTASSGAHVTIEADTLITDNHSLDATVGGGVDCRSGASIDIHGDVTHNSATEGGGVRAEGSCFLELFPGAYIANNTATRGGGVYLESGAFFGGGGSTTRAFIASNTADEGGGLYVTDSGSNASFFNLEVIDNRATQLGAGAMATNGGRFSMNRSTTVPCNNQRCSRLSVNRNTAPGSNGSAAYARSGGTVVLDQTYVEKNDGFAGAGSLLVVEGVDSTIELEGVQIWNNQANTLLSAFSGGHVRAGFVSAARNLWLSTSGLQDSIGARALTGSVDLFSSVLVDIAEYEGDVDADCLISNTSQGLDFMFWVTVADPRFLNADAGDLHLRPDSPAIDYCDAIAFPPTRLDVDLDSRSYDRPGVDNAVVNGIIDLGIDEAVGIFWDGFESGDLTGWTSSTP